jgi:hypothetical protein
MAKIDQVISDIGTIKTDIGVIQNNIGTIQQDIHGVRTNGKEIATKVYENRDDILKLKTKNCAKEEVKKDVERRSGKNYILYGGLIGLSGAIVASIIIKFL